MFKRLLAAVLLLFVAYPAAARMDLRQNGDGTADWVGSKQDGRWAKCAGGAIVQIPVQLNNTASAFGISPMTNAVIRNVYATWSPTTSGSQSVLKFFAPRGVAIGSASSVNPLSFSIANGSATTPVTLWMGGTAGTVSRISQFVDVTGAVKLANHALHEGDWIGIANTGAATGLATGQVFIQVCPR